MEVARCGMVQPSASGTQAMRAVFFIAPRHIALVYYPLSNGRNFDEIKRLLIAMQTSDKAQVATRRTGARAKGDMPPPDLWTGQ